MSVARARMDRRGRARGTPSLGAGPWLVARRVRFEPGSAVAMFLLVGATCFVFAALPRLFNTFADDGLRYTVANAPPSARNVRQVETTRIAARAGAYLLANVAGRAARSQQALPAPLRQLIARRTFVVRSPRYVQSSGASVPGLVRYISLRAQSGVDPHIRLVSGHLPRRSSERVRAVLRRASVVAPELSTTSEVPVLQVALSTSAARELQLHVGDRLIFTPSVFGPNDVDISRIPIHDEQPLAIEVAGLFAVKDPAAAFWFGDETLDRPEIQQSPDLSTKLVYGQALVLPEQYETVLGATEPVPLTYEYRYFVDAGRLDAGGLPQLRDAVARVDARYAGAGRLETHVDVGLGPVLDRYERARSQAETLLAVAAIGLLACALANLGLLGALAYDRRRTETGLSRTRGASPRHMLAAQAVEGLLIAAPAGIAGWAVAVLTIRARGSGLSAWLALAIVVGTIVLLVAAIAGVARRPLRPRGRDDVVLADPSPGRLAVEGLVALAAALGVYLLRRRGLEASSSSAGGFDPYLAGVPVLLGLASGIVALRLYPWPITGAARLARRGRGLALHLGLSRAARQPDATSLPLLVLVLALAIACFSAVMLHTLEAGQERTGWRAVGADLRIDAPEDESLPPRLVARLDSIGDVARAYVQEAGPPAGGATPLLVALDVPAYERVIAGTPTAFRLPRVLGRPPPIPSVVPALISTNWPSPHRGGAQPPRLAAGGERAPRLPRRDRRRGAVRRGRSRADGVDRGALAVARPRSRPDHG